MDGTEASEMLAPKPQGSKEPPEVPDAVIPRPPDMVGGIAMLPVLAVEINECRKGNVCWRVARIGLPAHAVFKGDRPHIMSRIGLVRLLTRRVSSTSSISCAAEAFA
jgi:hypothetical protein